MTEPALRFDAVDFSYAPKQTALEHVSFALAPGERVALLGANGAGKSTVFLLATGLLLPTKGTVSVGALRVERPNLRAVRSQLALVFADPDDQLFCSTVLDEVAFGPRHRGTSEERSAALAREHLASVGLSAYEQREPLQLSLGEKKRVALAAALATEAPLLLLDEPTSGLDPRARRELLAILAKLPCALLLATHDLEAARTLCPRSLVLDQGKLVRDTETETLLNDAALLEQHGLA